MRVLVTGGAGYVGSHTAKALARAGITPVVYDNLSLGHIWAVRWGPLFVGDLNDAAALRQVFQEYRPDAVVHFAAKAYVGESMTDPSGYLRNNVGGTLQLLDAMREFDVRTIVFSSSCATYGIPDALPLVETHPQRPINPYGDSKLWCERALGWYEKAYGLRWVALRYFNAAGADPDGEIGEDHEPETHLIPLAIHAALGKIDRLTIFGTDYATPDGTAIRDYIHVADLAHAHVAALRHLENGGRSIAVNLGTGTGYSIREVVEQVEAASGKRVPLSVGPRRDGDPAALVADSSLAAQVLSWQPARSDLSSIIRSAWDWHSRIQPNGAIRQVAAEAAGGRPR
jgi:UDP-arabinose 4-epimerase